MANQLKLAVLISGRGSNLQALIDATIEPTFPAEITRIISNEPDAAGLERAVEADISSTIVPHRDYLDRQSFEAALDKVVRDSGAELIVLAGFMRLLTRDFVDAWRDKLINIHPSLLPSFKGMHTHERVLEAWVRFTGCTVHYVRPEMDEGPIIIQAAVPVLPGDNKNDLAARILKQEHVIYPLAVRLIAEGRVRVQKERVIIEDAGLSAPTSTINPVP
ncbi:MAG: phosphoribosylglycinamide formyltransferase [Pseudomonadota bacterium]|nr:phosphoribosylglycinamide formyltransferase [Pseudomonadota bacterium]